MRLSAGVHWFLPTLPVHVLDAAVPGPTAVFEAGIHGDEIAGVHALEELLEELDTGQYDLLAIGAQRVESPLSRILYEDIAADLLELSPIPVLVAKGMPAIAAE